MQNAYSIPMQSTVGGLAANIGANTAGETVFGELDLATGVLMVDVSVSVRAGDAEVPRVGCAVVSNNPMADADQLFTEADLRDAIADYFTFAGRGLLVIEDAVARHNPASKIEPDGVDDHGRRYRIANDMTNGQLAVIVMCWFAAKQAGFTRQMAAFDDLADVNVTSVGLPTGDSRVKGYAGMLPVDGEGWPV